MSNKLTGSGKRTAAEHAQWTASTSTNHEHRPNVSLALPSHNNTAPRSSLCSLSYSSLCRYVHLYATTFISMFLYHTHLYVATFISMFSIILISMLLRSFLCFSIILISMPPRSSLCSLSYSSLCC